MQRNGFLPRKTLLFGAIIGCFFFPKNGAANEPSAFLVNKLACDFTLSFQILSDYNGFGVSCSDSKDGSVAMTSAMAVQPLDVYWSSGEINPTAEKLPGGWSYISVTDATGCRVVDSVFLKKPAQFQPIFEVFGEKCQGTTDGRIEIQSVSGGVEPLFYSINDLSGPLGAAIGPLGAGTFFMETVDANNCRDTFGFVVPAGLPFDFEIGIDSATIFSGDTFWLDLQLPATVDSVFWTPAATKSSFFSTDFAPSSTTTFVATAINSLGCKASDKFALFVKTKRDFYSPNIIQRSASLDENRFFTIYTSGGVVKIELLEVFDRWGNLVFQKKNFPASLPEEGWDGHFNGKKAAVGIFTFRTILRQTNGKPKLYLGEFLVAD